MTYRHTLQATGNGVGYKLGLHTGDCDGSRCPECGCCMHCSDVRHEPCVCNDPQCGCNPGTQVA